MLREECIGAKDRVTLFPPSPQDPAPCSVLSENHRNAMTNVRDTSPCVALMFIEGYSLRYKYTSLVTERNCSLTLQRELAAPCAE